MIHYCYRTDFFRQTLLLHSKDCFIFNHIPFIQLDEITNKLNQLGDNTIGVWNPARTLPIHLNQSSTLNPAAHP